MNDIALNNQAALALQAGKSALPASVQKQIPSQNGLFEKTLAERRQAQAEQALGTVGASKGNYSPDALAATRKTATDFEAVFLSQMLQPMFEGIKSEEPFGGGHAEEMWRSMLVDEYGKTLANTGGIGLADQVQRELLRAQEGH